MRIIPVDVVIPKEQRDTSLGETLQLHADAILSWAIKGYFDYEDNGGMREPEAVLAATKDYKNDSDDIQRFLDSRCVVGKEHRISASELWLAWMNFREEEGLELIAKQYFGRTLNLKGFGTKYHLNVQTRLGITLLSKVENQ